MDKNERGGGIIIFETKVINKTIEKLVFLYGDCTEKLVFLYVGCTDCLVQNDNNFTLVVTENNIRIDFFMPTRAKCAVE